MKITKSWYDVIMLVILYLVSSTNFYTSFVNDSIVIFIISLSLRLIFLIFAFFFIKKNNLPFPLFHKLKWQHLLLFPLFLSVFSNLFVAIIGRTSLNQDVHSLPILLDSSITLLISISEEIVFRVVIFTQWLKTKKPLQAIVYSSLVFGLVHLVNISSLSSIIPVLSQVAYAFFLGLGCALGYFWTKNFFIPLIFHFGFNFFNQVLTKALYALPQNEIFYLVSILIIVLGGLYGLWLYWYIFKKGNTTHATKYLDF